MPARYLNVVIFLLCSLCIKFCIAESMQEKIGTNASSCSIDDVRQRLDSQYMKGLLDRSYQSIVRRAYSNGYFQESLTGAYQGMFPRTTGALGRLLIETGKLDILEANLNYCLEAMLDNDMERMPHIIGVCESLKVPVPGENSPACLGHNIPFAKLSGKYGAIQYFTATGKPLEAIGVYIGRFVAGNELAAEIYDSKGIKLADAKCCFDEQVVHGWVQLKFTSPVKLPDGEKCRVVLHAENEANDPIVYSGIKPDSKWLGSASQFEDGREIHNPNNCLSIVFDHGDVNYEYASPKYQILSELDQIDGQAHVIMAWALLALNRGETEFENKTYSVVAKLMDRSTTGPYLLLDFGLRIKPGLVCNNVLEHSRDTQYWHAYDFLTQSFICSALENMIQVAKRRQDTVHAERWSYRLGRLNYNIMRNMTRDFEGDKIFYEMLLPTGREPEPFPGIGWINLAPIPAGWNSVDKEVFKNTIDTWHRVARIDWDGPQMTSSDWLPEGEVDVYGHQMSNQVIGKVLGWDLIYCLRAGEYDRVCGMLDFIEKVNSTELIAEAFNYDPQSKSWHLQDPGNGEQACWWCWAMIVIRQEVGLSPLPE